MGGIVWGGVPPDRPTPKTVIPRLRVRKFVSMAHRKSLWDQIFQDVPEWGQIVIIGAIVIAGAIWIVSRM